MVRYTRYMKRPQMSFQDDFNQAIGAKPVVDFDYFHFPIDLNNRKIAEKLTVILMAYTSVDELHNIVNDNESWPSTVGTGGSGWNYACSSQSAQRSCLASYFSSYAYGQHTSCFLGLPEYQCLKDLLRYLEEDSLMDHRYQMINEAIELIKMTCACFEMRYLREEPGFLFELIKKETEA